jgi:hypothetical protein
MLLMVLFLPINGDVRREYTPAKNIIEKIFYTHFDYTLRWGTKNFMRSLPDTFTVDGLNHPHFWYESDKYVLLKVNQNNYRSHLFVLPLNDSSRVQHFSDPIAFNARANLLAYMGSSPTVNFIDLVTGAHSSLKIALPKGAKDVLSVLHSAILTKTELRLQWINTPPSEKHVYRIPKLVQPRAH